MTESNITRLKPKRTMGPDRSQRFAQIWGTQLAVLVSYVNGWFTGGLLRLHDDVLWLPGLCVFEAPMIPSDGVSSLRRHARTRAPSVTCLSSDFAGMLAARLLFRTRLMSLRSTLNPWS